MCVVALSFDPSNVDEKLVVIANRDEFYARPTLDADWWNKGEVVEEEEEEDQEKQAKKKKKKKKNILGGRDLKRGGAQIAVNNSGRFATVTNFSYETVRGVKSRGALVTDFLRTSLSPMEYLEQIEPQDYAGFNLIVYDEETSTLAFLTNRDEARVGPQILPPGVYGVSNGTLDEWDKVDFLKSGLSFLQMEEMRHLDEELFALLTYGRNKVDGNSFNLRTSTCSSRSDSSLPSLVTSDYDEDSDSGHLYYEDCSDSTFSLESTTVFEEDPLDELPLAKTKPFLFRPKLGYGTRCSTIVRCNKNSKWNFIERRFDQDGSIVGETREIFEAQLWRELTY